MDVLDFLIPGVEGGNRLYAAAQGLKIEAVHQFEIYTRKELISKGAKREDIGNLEKALEPLGIRLKDSDSGKVKGYKRLEHNNRKTYALVNYKVKLEGADKVWVNDVYVSVPKTGRHVLTQDQLYKMFEGYKKNPDFDALASKVGVSRFTVIVYLNKSGILRRAEDLRAEGLLK
ncbi:MAG: hypothetical protein AABX35_02500 [Nanoarchaeota archaeon]